MAEIGFQQKHAWTVEVDTRGLLSFGLYKHSKCQRMWHKGIISSALGKKKGEIYQLCTLNAHWFEAEMSILYSSHTSPNFVPIDVVTPVGTLNIIAYHGGLCRLEKGSEAGICQGPRGCGGSTGVVGERVS